LRSESNPRARGVLDEAVELREAERLLVEVRVELEDDLLQPVGAHDVAVLDHLADGPFDQLPRIRAHAVSSPARVSPVSAEYE
jgi:hypothetical protein